MHPQDILYQRKLTAVVGSFTLITTARTGFSFTSLGNKTHSKPIHGNTHAAVSNSQHGSRWPAGLRANNGPAGQFHRRPAATSRKSTSVRRSQISTGTLERKDGSPPSCLHQNSRPRCVGGESGGNDLAYFQDDCRKVRKESSTYGLSVSL